MGGDLEGVGGMKICDQDIVYEFFQLKSKINKSLNLNLFIYLL